jgi:hypothetical protein
MTLENLRKKFIDAELAVAALNSAIAVTKLDAQAALQFAKESDSDDLSDLTAINNRYKEQLADLEGAKLGYDTARRLIIEWYSARKPVDWRVSLTPGTIYDSWYGATKDGNIATINIELCGAEVEALKPLLGNYVKLVSRSVGGYQLKAEYSYYRGNCWADYSGEQIQQKLLPLLGEKRRQRIETLASFEVLR